MTGPERPTIFPEALAAVKSGTEAAPAACCTVGGHYLGKAMDKIWHMGPRGDYTRKKRAGERLNLTPKPDLALPGRTEALPG